ncbi:hypothetical protein B0H14DRAFT_3445994 [Mycena olivaceomarginata]|nr:hypothetical protein B0H14DRAFT_3445994 [Mycena olivaceomarginata]
MELAATSRCCHGQHHAAPPHFAAAPIHVAVAPIQPRATSPLPRSTSPLPRSNLVPLRSRHAARATAWGATLLRRTGRLAKTPTLCVRMPALIHTPRVDVSTDLRHLLGAVSQIHTPDGHLFSMDLPFLLTAPPAPRLVARPFRNPALNERLSMEFASPRGAPFQSCIATNLECPSSTPESGVDDPVGHLIPVDAAAARLPWVDFAYSCGHPDGGTASGDFSYTPLLVDRHGIPVPCKKRHATCQGVKACPHNNTAALTGRDHWHTSATRQDVERQLAAERAARQRLTSPQRVIFDKTAAYIAAAKNSRTTRTTKLNSIHSRRGYSSAPTCEGRIIYHEYPDPVHKGATPRAYLSCEHYSRRTPDHWADFTIQDGGYDVDYIAAYFLGNTDEVGRIEEAAAFQDQGPLAFCNTLRNYTAQTLHCPVDHRVDGRLAQVELCHLECEVKFRIWARTDTPIPLPEKTPQRVRQQILELLGTLRQDLPDMTARRFLRHPALKSFLMKMFPHISLPTLSAIHPSLANRAHLGAYIAPAQEEHFPDGTDWRGVQHLKKLQDAKLPAHLHYIRLMLEIDDATLPAHDEDDDDTPPSSDKKTRIIICMAPDSSARLQQAQCLQSDIGFKRIVGFDEFEIASMDRDANTSIVFCRVYLTRHTAAAHQRIFQELNELVHHDTGCPLHWRHLHGRSPDDFSVGLILHWGADQHRGQAKGLGLHLVDRAAELPLDTMDLHEPNRPLHQLGPYDHLRRVYRVCRVHNFRNIQQCAVPDHVRRLMRSLACIRHEDWAGTIARILCDGGKAAADWIRDKESCQFAFPGICWERSFIPLPVWEAGDPHTNLVETVHSDVNRDGVHSTLLGGLLRGQDYDQMQRATLLQYERHGIRPSYKAVASITNAQKNVIRRDHRRSQQLQTTALAISTHNTSMVKSDAKLREALARFNRFERLVAAPHLTQEMHTELQRQLRTASNEAIAAARKYDKQVKVGEALRAAGCYGVTLPT